MSCLSWNWKAVGVIEFFGWYFWTSGHCSSTVIYISIMYHICLILNALSGDVAQYIIKVYMFFFWPPVGAARSIQTQHAFTSD